LFGPGLTSLWLPLPFGDGVRRIEVKTLPDTCERRASDDAIAKSADALTWCVRAKILTDQSGSINASDDIRAAEKAG